MIPEISINIEREKEGSVSFLITIHKVDAELTFGESEPLSFSKTSMNIFIRTSPPHVSISIHY
jgi:hypothetical protein